MYQIDFGMVLGSTQHSLTDTEFFDELRSQLAIGAANQQRHVALIWRQLRSQFSSEHLLVIMSSKEIEIGQVEIHRQARVQ
jgi:hypothetical protein